MLHLVLGGNAMSVFAAVGQKQEQTGWEIGGRSVLGAQSPVLTVHRSDRGWRCCCACSHLEASLANAGKGERGNKNKEINKSLISHEQA